MFEGTENGYGTMQTANSGATLDAWLTCANE